MNDITRIAFSELGKVIAGQHIPAEQYNGDEGGTPYLTGPADFTDRIPHVTKWTNHPRSFAESGDVLLTVKGAGCGKSNLGLDAAIGRQLMALRPNKAKLDRNYLFAFIRSQEARICALGQGATVPGISKGDIEKLHIPCFPLPEQRRIAAVLDKADAIRRKREEGIRLTEELLRSTFLEMFGDPATNPKGWDIVTVSQIVREMEGGKSILADADESASTPYRVLKVSAVTWADYRPDESKPVPIDYAPPPAHIVKKGDLLFSRANTTELVGATVYVFDTPPNRLLPDKLWRFVWNDEKAIDPQYIRVLFMTAAIKRELGKRATGTSGSMKNISKAKLMTIPIPFPPIGIQRKFGVFAMSQHRLLTERQQGAISTSLLFRSLVQRAFRGELTNGGSK